MLKVPVDKRIFFDMIQWPLVQRKCVCYKLKPLALDFRYKIILLLKTVFSAWSQDTDTMKK